jgi:hypothetical protein
MNTNLTDRLNLDQLVDFFRDNNMPYCAGIFVRLYNSSVTVDGWIEESYVKKSMTMFIRKDKTFWNRLKANVTTAIYC